MAAASDYLEAAVFNYFFRGQTVAQPSELYLALYINDPTDADTGSEINKTGYARQKIKFDAPTQVGDKGSIINTDTIEYPIAEADWGQISHWAVRTAATGGQMLTRGAFSRLETIKEGNKFIIEKGNLQITME